MLRYVGVISTVQRVSYQRRPEEMAWLWRAFDAQRDLCRVKDVARMRDVSMDECEVISGRRDNIVLMTLMGKLHRACCFRSCGVQYLFHLAPILAHPPLHLLADMAADLTWHLALGLVLLTWLVDVFAAGQSGMTCGSLALGA